MQAINCQGYTAMTMSLRTRVLRPTCSDVSRSAHQLRASNLWTDAIRTKYETQFLIHLLFQPPRDSERVPTFAGADEPALFQRLDGIAIGGQRAYFFIIFQPPQNWVAAERISFKLVPVLDVRQQVLFDLSEFWREISSFLLHFVHVYSQ